MYNSSTRDLSQDSSASLSNSGQKKSEHAGPKSFYKNTDVLKIIQAEYSINHCSTEIRTLLCKGSTQEKIREFCEAYVSTKGRYIPPGQHPHEDSEKPFGLYLFIQGPNKQSVDLAISMIEGIIATGEMPRAPPLMSLNALPPPAIGPPPPTSQPNIHTLPPPPANIHSIVQMQVPPPAINLVEKLPIGIERPLPGFNLPMKLIGQNGANLQYIRNETGAVVTLRGIGSAFIEPTTGQEAQEVLHFSIEHSKPDGLATARELALNLISTVQQEYAQYATSQGATVQSVPVDPNLMLHQPSVEQQIIHQPVLATSITLPVMQAPATGVIQQPTMTSIPAQFTHPPPTQLSLPPPGVHIPQQPGPLGPPGVHIPQNQGPMVPPPLGPPPHDASVPPPGQQYLLTQNGQPVQGIVTSQGFVVLNQQPQQVYFSQPGSATPILHQSQFSFPPGNPTSVATPVSYQLQYVQHNPIMTMAGSSLQQPQQHQQHAVLFQQQAQNHMPNGAVQINQQQSSANSQMLQQGHLVQVKSQPAPLMQPYPPQYLSSPGLNQEQPRPTPPKESRLGKRKFTEEAEPHPLKQSPQALPPNMQQPHQMQPPPQHMLVNPQQLMQPPPPHFQPGPPQPQPVPHPSQTSPHLRHGIGMQDLMSLNLHENGSPGNKIAAEGSQGEPGKGEGGAGNSPPLTQHQGNNQFSTPPPMGPPTGEVQKQWFEHDQKGRKDKPGMEFTGNTYARRDRFPREPPAMTHYSSKPQMYMPPASVCPPPPPPPPPQQQHYYYGRR